MSLPVHLFLVGEYGTFGTELLAACAQAQHPVQLHPIGASKTEWRVVAQQQGVLAPTAVLILSSKAPVSTFSALPLPVLVVSGQAAAFKGDENREVLQCAPHDLARALAVLFTRAQAAYAAHYPVPVAPARRTRAMRSRLAARVLDVQQDASLLSEMSHEIRTPLTTILGFADVLAHSLEGEQRMLAEMITQGGQRLSDIINSVLDFARIDAGHAALQLNRTDVAAEVAEVVSFFVPQAMAKGLDLRVIPPATPTWADIDSAMLVRILNNLVGNALKFTEVGHVHVRVTATTAAITLHVEDTGKGIDASFLPSLFQAYRQGPENSLGSGLGLAITRRLVHMAGGQISVHSMPGEGTIFTVILPRYIESPRFVEAPTQELTAPANLPPHGTSGSSLPHYGNNKATPHMQH